MLISGSRLLQTVTHPSVGSLCSDTKEQDVPQNACIIISKKNFLTQSEQLQKDIIFIKLHDKICHHLGLMTFEQFNHSIHSIGTTFSLKVDAVSAIKDMIKLDKGFYIRLNKVMIVSQVS